VTARDAPPSFELLLDYLEGRVTDEQRVQVERALAEQDPRAEDLRDWIRGFHAQARQSRHGPPPPLLAQRLRRIPLLLQGRAPMVRTLTAEPVLDSRSSKRLTGVRGPAIDSGDRFQVTCRAGDYSVVLDLAPVSNGTVTLRGQVLPEHRTLPVFEASVCGPYGSITSITGDEHGGFEIKAVPPGTSRLTLTNDLVLIVISADIWGTAS